MTETSGKSCVSGWTGPQRERRSDRGGGEATTTREKVTVADNQLSFRENIGLKFSSSASLDIHSPPP